nr:Mediator of RNA polymerase II transcription subunit like [Ipomoea batatas]
MRSDGAAVEFTSWTAGCGTLDTVVCATASHSCVCATEAFGGGGPVAACGSGGMAMEADAVRQVGGAVATVWAAATRTGFSVSAAESTPSSVDLFLNSNATLLHALLPLLAIAALTHALNARLTFVKSQAPVVVSGTRLYTCWVLLCTLQVCVGLGIEGSIAANVVGVSSLLNVNRQRSLLSRALFFLGLHQTMLFWSKTVVKPVVDDTIFGFSRRDRWVDKAAMAAGFGGLWWWKLREEVEALVVVAEVKRDLSMGVGVADFVGWWLYYLTITIGIVKVVKTVIGLPLVFFYRRIHQDANAVSLRNWRVNDNV